MLDVELYKKIISLFDGETKNIIAEYGDLIRWPESNATILDVGCGEGTTTATILQDYIAQNVQNYKSVGVNLLEKTITSAKENFGQEENIEFKVMDIGADYIRYPSLLQRFDIAFSLMCLHWAPNNNWIRNIYSMLKPNGQVFLIAADVNQMAYICKELGKTEKWSKYYTKESVMTINPFTTYGDTEVLLTTLLKETGFKNIVHKLIYRPVEISDKNILRDILTGFSAFHEHIPENKKTEFIDDFLERAVEICCVRVGETKLSLTSFFVLIVADK